MSTFIYNNLPCPICGKPFHHHCPHTANDLIKAVYEARYWAGKMQDRARRAERQLTAHTFLHSHLNDLWIANIEDVERRLDTAISALEDINHGAPVSVDQAEKIYRNIAAEALKKLRGVGG